MTTDLLESLNDCRDLDENRKEAASTEVTVHLRLLKTSCKLVVFIEPSGRARCHFIPPLKLIWIWLLLTHLCIYVQDNALDLYDNLSS